MGFNTTVDTASPKRTTFSHLVKTAVDLFKLRIVFLLLFAALAGAFLGEAGVPSIKALAQIIFSGTLAAAGASAINQYLEQQTDARMSRTQKRPLAAGQIRRPNLILAAALVMIVTAVLAVLPGNPVMAFYLGAGALIYVGVYTIWLKPRSMLNIVIGGAAGSCAVMTGGAAVGGSADPGVIALALLLFLWTPAHFWSLAIFYKDDYLEAGIPMLPAQVSPRHSAWWILIHAAGTAFVAVILAAHPALGWIYLVPTTLTALVMLTGSVKLIFKPDRKQAIRVFVTSNIFLTMVMLAVIIGTVGN